MFDKENFKFTNKTFKNSYVWFAKFLAIPLLSIVDIIFIFPFINSLIIFLEKGEFSENLLFIIFIIGSIRGIYMSIPNFSLVKCELTENGLIYRKREELQLIPFEKIEKIIPHNLDKNSEKTIRVRVLFDRGEILVIMRRITKDNPDHITLHDIFKPARITDHLQNLINLVNEKKASKQNI